MQFQEAGRAAAQLDAATNCERALQLALLADASDENMILVRYADLGEDCPHEKLGEECDMFLRRCEALFDRGQCFSTGYTGHMVALLHEGLATFIGDAPHYIGGKSSDPLTDDVKARCLGRMQNWLKLVRLAIRAEFPETSILRAMGAFSLSPTSGASQTLGGKLDKVFLRWPTGTFQVCKIC